MLPGLIDLFLHLDQNLPFVIAEYGLATYAIQFTLFRIARGSLRRRPA